MARHLLAWLALVSVSGCSLALDGPKPNRPRGYQPTCDDSKGLVVADGLLATAVGIGALTAFSDDATEAGVVLGLIGVAFTASALRGNGVVNACRAEQARFAQESGPYLPDDDDAPRTARTSAPLATAGRRAAPPPMTPPPPPTTTTATTTTTTVAPTTPVVAGPTAPADPYAEPRTARPAPPTTKPAASKPVAPAPAPSPDADAWRDFWTEVP